MRSIGNITRPNLGGCKVGQLLAKAVLICQSNQSKNNPKYKETDDHLDSQGI